METKKLYIVSNRDTDYEKVVKLTREQANAIDWIFRVFLEEDYYTIGLAEDSESVVEL